VEQAHGAGPGLIQSGKQYASRVAQEAKKIRESTRALQTLQGMKDSGLKVPFLLKKSFEFTCLRFPWFYRVIRMNPTDLILTPKSMKSKTN
jgi:hypothetical protein